MSPVYVECRSPWIDTIVSLKTSHIIELCETLAL